MDIFHKISLHLSFPYFFPLSSKPYCCVHFCRSNATRLNMIIWIMDTLQMTSKGALKAVTLSRNVFVLSLSFGERVGSKKFENIFRKDTPQWMKMKSEFDEPNRINLNDSRDIKNEWSRKLLRITGFSWTSHDSLSFLSHMTHFYHIVNFN